MKGGLRTLFMGLVGALLLGGCATAGGMVAAKYLGKQVTLEIDSQIPFPEELTLKGFEDIEGTAGARFFDEMLGKLTGVKLRERLAREVIKSTEPYGISLASRFREELKNQNIFGAVVDQGGDVALKLRIREYGLDATEGLKKIVPLLEVQADLVVPGLGVVWTESFAVPAWSRQLSGMAIEMLLENGDVYKSGFDAAASVAATELVRRMK